jgi:hypothetical protein
MPRAEVPKPKGDEPMKSAMFAVALMIGGAAIAQDDPTATTSTMPPAETTVPAPAEASMPATAPMAATPQTVAPGNTAPERDARGIPVISDPATAPAGFNSPPGVGGPLVDASQPPATQPATENYPPCTREVTDNCVQTYERGRSPTR